MNWFWAPFSAARLCCAILQPLHYTVTRQLPSRSDLFIMIAASQHFLLEAGANKIPMSIDVRSTAHSNSCSKVLMARSHKGVVFSPQVSASGTPNLHGSHPSVTEGDSHFLGKVVSLSHSIGKRFVLSTRARFKVVLVALHFWGFRTQRCVRTITWWHRSDPTPPQVVMDHHHLSFVKLPNRLAQAVAIMEAQAHWGDGCAHVSFLSYLFSISEVLAVQFQLLWSGYYYCCFES